MMGLPILGSIYNIKNINRDMIVQYHNENYIGQNIIIVGTGNFQHKKLVDLVDQYFGKFPKGDAKYIVLFYIIFL